MAPGQQNPYAVMDVLRERWDELEQQVKRYIIPKENGCELYTQRVGAHAKLCYKDRPVSECKAQDKIAAGAHLASFQQNVMAVRAAITRGGLEVAHALLHYTQALKELHDGDRTTQDGGREVPG
jgi:hypothetical protein